MQIVNYDGSDKNWKLFYRKCGQQNWEWKESYTDFISDNGLIDMSKFYSDGRHNVYEDYDELLECDSDMLKEFVEQQEFSKARCLIDDFEEMADVKEDEIIVYDTINGGYWKEDRYKSSHLEDATEFQVGVAIEE